MSCGRLLRGCPSPALVPVFFWFGVRGLGFGLRHVGFRGQGFGFSWDSEFRVMGLGCREGIFAEIMTSDRKLKASREGSR